MGGSKQKKRVVQKETPPERHVGQRENPDKYGTMKPAWNFNSYDQQCWSFTKENVGDAFWEEIFPFLVSLETQTWNEILIRAKKKNHHIDIKNLNTGAQNRLEELKIEKESILSLRLTSTHRIYGYVVNGIFYVLWYDNNHGDNTSCVCRSHLKHT